MPLWNESSTAYDRDRRRQPRSLGLCIAVCVCTFIVSVGCVSFDELTRATESEFPRAETCGECHKEVYREWAASPHARAFTSDRFRGATDNYRFEKCLGCHAPTAQYTQGEPLARSVWREEGITCVSCHLEEGSLSGPVATTGLVTPHPVGTANDRYRDSRFCGRCHQGTYAEWEGAAVQEKKTCQQCHMPTVHRKLTQPTDTVSSVIVAFEEEIPQRRHLFAVAVDGLDADPFTLEVSHPEEAFVSFSLRNNLPHAAPTGDFGVRTITIRASTGIDTEHLEPQQEWELAAKLGSALPPGSSSTWRLAIPAGHTQLRVQLFRHVPDSETDSLLFDSVQKL